eukprot:g1538.t1
MTRPTALIRVAIDEAVRYIGSDKKSDRKKGTRKLQRVLRDLEIEDSGVENVERASDSIVRSGRRDSSFDLSHRWKLVLEAVCGCAWRETAQKSKAASSNSSIVDTLKALKDLVRYTHKIVPGSLVPLCVGKREKEEEIGVLWTICIQVLTNPHALSGAIFEIAHILLILLDHRSYTILLRSRHLQDILHMLFEIVEDEGGNGYHTRVKQRCMHVVRQIIANFSNTARLKSNLSSIFEFVGGFVPPPSSAPDIPMHREYVACLCALMRRFPLDVRPLLTSTQDRDGRGRVSLLRWIVMVWQQTVPESPLAKLVVEYFRLRLRCSQMIACCSGQSPPALIDDDELLDDDCAALLEAVDRTTRLKFLLPSNDERSSSSASSSSSSASSSMPLTSGDRRWSSRREADDSPVLCYRDTFGDELSRASRWWSRLSASSSHKSSSYTLRLLVSAELVWTMDYHIVRPRRRRRRLHVDNAEGAARSASPLSYLSRMTPKGIVLASEAANDGDDEGKSFAKMPPWRASTRRILKRAQDNNEHTTTVQASLRLFYAVLSRAGDSLALRACDGTLEDMLSSLGSLTLPSSPYGPDTAKLSARVLTKLARALLSSSSSLPFPSIWQRVRSACLSLLASNRWTCDSAADGLGSACAGLLRVVGVKRCCGAIVDGGVVSTSVMKAIVHARGSGVLVSGMFANSNLRSLVDRIEAQRCIVRWWTDAIASQISSKPSACGESALHDCVDSSVDDLCKLLCPNIAPRRIDVASLERNDCSVSVRQCLAIGADYLPRDVSRAEVKTFRYLVPVYTHVFTASSSGMVKTIGSDRGTADRRGTASGKIPLPSRERRILLEHLDRDLTKTVAVLKDSLQESAASPAKLAFAISAAIALRRLIRRVRVRVRKGLRDVVDDIDHIVDTNDDDGTTVRAKFETGGEEDVVWARIGKTERDLETLISNAIENVARDVSLPMKETSLAANLLVMRRASSPVTSPFDVVLVGESSRLRLHNTALACVEQICASDRDDSGAAGRPQDETGSRNDSDDDGVFGASTRTAAASSVSSCSLRSRSGITSSQGTTSLSSSFGAGAFEGNGDDARHFDTSGGRKSDWGEWAGETKTSGHADTHVSRQLLIALNRGNHAALTGDVTAPFGYIYALECVHILSAYTCVLLRDNTTTTGSRENVGDADRSIRACGVLLRCALRRFRGRSRANLALAALRSQMKIVAVACRLATAATRAARCGTNISAFLNEIVASVERCVTNFAGDAKSSCGMLLSLREFCVALPIPDDFEEAESRGVSGSGEVAETTSSSSPSWERLEGNLTAKVREWMERLGCNRCAWSSGSVRRAWLLCASEWFRVNDEVVLKLLRAQALNLLLDPEPSVRATASAAVAALFPETIDDSEDGGMRTISIGDVMKRLVTRLTPQLNGKKELSLWENMNVRTLKHDARADAAFLLGEIVQRSANVRDQTVALYHLLRLAEDAQNRMLARKIIDTSAKATGFPSGASLVAARLESVLSMWLTDSMSASSETSARGSLKTFPFTLLGPIRRLKTFIEGSISVLLPICLLQPEARRIDLLETLFTELQSPNSQHLLEANLGHLYGPLLFLSFSKVPKDCRSATSAITYVSHRVGGFKSFWSKFTQSASLIAHVVQRVYDCAVLFPSPFTFGSSHDDGDDEMDDDGENEDEGKGDVEGDGLWTYESQISVSLKHFARRFGKTVPALLERAGGVRLLHYLNRRMAALSSRSERAKQTSKLRWLRAFKSCLCEMKENRFKPETLRFATSTVRRELESAKNPIEYDRICLEIVHSLLIEQGNDTGTSQASLSSSSPRMTQSSDDSFSRKRGKRNDSGREEATRQLREAHISATIRVLQLRCRSLKGWSNIAKEFHAAIAGLRRALRSTTTHHRREENTGDLSTKRVPGAHLRSFLRNHDAICHLWTSDSATALPSVELCAENLRNLLTSLKERDAVALSEKIPSMLDAHALPSSSDATMYSPVSRKLFFLLRHSRLPRYLRRLAALCLSRLGVVDASILDEDSRIKSSTPSTSDSGDRGRKCRPSQGKIGSSDVVVQRLRVEILAQAGRSLVDRRPDIVQAAVVTTEKMFATDDGQNTYAQMSVKNCLVLKPFLRPVVTSLSEGQPRKVNNGSADVDDETLPRGRKRARESHCTSICEQRCSNIEKRTWPPPSVDLTDDVDFDDWLRNLTTSVILFKVDDLFLRACVPLIEADAAFASVVFPLAVLFSVRDSPSSFEKESAASVLGDAFCTILRETPSRRAGEQIGLRKSQRLVLDSLLFLRRFGLLDTTMGTIIESSLSSSPASSPVTKKKKATRRSPRRLKRNDGRVLASEKRSSLRVPPLLVARAALVCEMYHVSLLFLNLRTSTRDYVRIGGEEEKSYPNTADLHTKSKEALLLETHANLNEPDGRSGIMDACEVSGSAGTWAAPSFHYGSKADERLTSTNARIQVRSIAAGGSYNRDFHANLIRALHHQGLYAVGSLCADGAASISTSDEARTLDELRYEAAYRMGRWDCAPSNDDDATRNIGMQRFTFEMIRAVRSSDRTVYLTSREGLLDLLTGHFDVERRCGGKQAFRALVSLRALCEIENVWNMLSRKKAPQLQQQLGANLDRMTTLWSARASARGVDSFDLQEPLDAVREGLLRCVVDRLSPTAADATAARRVLAHHLCRSAASARKSDRPSIAAATLCRLREVMAGRETHSRGGRVGTPLGDPDDLATWEFEEARCLWAMGETRRAMAIGKRLCASYAKPRAEGSVSATAKPSLVARILLTTGEWFAATRSEGSATIHSVYLANAARMAVEICETSKVSSESCASSVRFAGEASFKVARFVDGLHRKLLAQVTSKEWRKCAKDKLDLQKEIRAVQDQISSENATAASSDDGASKKKKRKAGGGEDEEGLEAHE